MSKGKKETVNPANYASTPEALAAMQAGGTQEGNGEAAATQAAPVESKAEKFRRLAIQRVPQAVKRINQLANLFGTKQYEHTPEQAEKVWNMLVGAMDVLEQRMKGEKAAKQSFTL